MASQIHYSCPHCDHDVHKPLASGEAFVCPQCRGRYRVLVDEPTGRAAMVDQDARRMTPPLGLPGGSVRALISLGLVGTFWVLVYHDRPVPAYLLSLLLTILGYYFGYRSEARQGRVVVFDAGARKERPLLLPAGVIRLLLVAAFVWAGSLLLARGQLAELHYLEFFVVLAGLLAGTLFGKALARLRRGGMAGTGTINHVKALLVLALTAFLVWAVLGGQESQLGSKWMMLLCAVVSFYYGSR